jgi:hypothetical protein
MLLNGSPLREYGPEVPLRNYNMGYTTEFSGQFNLDKPLTKAHREYLHKFNRTRRMHRNAICESMADPAREAVKLPIGKQGEFFVGGLGYAGQDRDDSIVEYNSPPATQPGLWCQWIPNEDGTAIVWDGGEKFYEYIPGIEYLIENFLRPWGYVLNGTVNWEGEGSDDTGKIRIKNNEVTAQMDSGW